MPTIPTYTKCIELGCKENRTKTSSFCLIHGGKPKAVNKDRWQNKKEYDSLFWKSTKRLQLSRQPLCASCLIKGVITQANHVDHVFPWTKIGTHAFKNNIFQSLCINCHSHKTALEQRDIVEWYKDKAYRHTVADYEFVLKSQQ
jgi:5-methylcytosine-specific restriction protein A